MLQKRTTHTHTHDVHFDSQRWFLFPTSSSISFPQRSLGPRLLSMFALSLSSTARCRCWKERSHGAGQENEGIFTTATRITSNVPNGGLGRADAGPISTERAPATDVRRISDLRPTRPKKEPPVGPFPFIPCLGFSFPGVSLRGFANNYSRRS